MHIVGYDTPDGPKCESDTREWVLGFLDSEDSIKRHKAKGWGPWLEHEESTADLIRRGKAIYPEYVYDVKEIYATDLACSLCENGEDHNPDNGECLDETCEDCGNKL